MLTQTQHLKSRARRIFTHHWNARSIVIDGMVRVELVKSPNPLYTELAMLCIVRV